MGFGLILAHGAVRVDFVFVFGAALPEVHLVHPLAVVPVQLGGQAGHLIGRKARVLQSGGLGSLQAHVGAAGGRAPGGGVLFLLALQNLTGAVHRAEVLSAAGPELHLVHKAPVVVVGNHHDALCLIFAQAKGGERGGLGGGLIDGAVLACGGGVGLDVVLHNLAGGGVHVVFIFHIVGPEFHLVDHPAVLHIKVHLGNGHLIGGQARVGQGGILGHLGADVAAVAGAAGGAHGGKGGGLAGEQQVQIVHGAAGQALKGEGGVLIHQLLDQLCLAQRDAVFVGLGLQILILVHHLAQDGPVDGAGGHHCVHCLGELAFQLGGAGGVVVLHGDQDGVGQLIHIAVFQQRAHQGVHRHIQRGTLQVHAVQHGGGVLVQGGGPQHPLAAVQHQLDAGVHIQRNNGRGGLGLIVVNGASANGQNQAGGSGQSGQTQGLAVFLFGILIRHGDYVSFPVITAKENAFHVVGCRVFQSGAQRLFHIAVGHCASSPSRMVFSFFRDR